MASIKRLKKEVEFLSAQLIGDCVDLVQTFSGKEAETLQLIEEVVALHNDTLDKINHPDGKDNPGLVRAHYKLVKSVYIEGINVAYKKLEGMIAN